MPAIWANASEKILQRYLTEPREIEHRMQIYCTVMHTQGLELDKDETRVLGKIKVKWNLMVA